MMNCKIKLIGFTTALIAFALVGAGARINGASAEAGKSADPPVARVKIHKGGGVSLDGQRVTLDVLRDRLGKHKEANGVVWYSREGADAKARETGEAVIKIIIDLKLPVRLMESDDE